jgi:hypothetical protein
MLLVKNYINMNKVKFSGNIYSFFVIHLQNKKDYKLLYDLFGIQHVFKIQWNFRLFIGEKILNFVDSYICFINNENILEKYFECLLKKEFFLIEYLSINNWLSMPYFWENDMNFLTKNFCLWSLFFFYFYIILLLYNLIFKFIQFIFFFTLNLKK